MAADQRIAKKDLLWPYSWWGTTQERRIEDIIKMVCRLTGLHERNVEVDSTTITLFDPARGMWIANYVVAPAARFNKHVPVKRPGTAWPIRIKMRSDWLHVMSAGDVPLPLRPRAKKILRARRLLAVYDTALTELLATFPEKYLSFLIMVYAGSNRAQLVRAHDALFLDPPAPPDKKKNAYSGDRLTTPIKFEVNGSPLDQYH